jgi:hypothetical protein
MLEPDADGADAPGDPLRDGVDLVEAATLCGEGASDLVD